MNKIMKKYLFFLGILCMSMGCLMGKMTGKAIQIPAKYQVPESTRQLVVVRYRGESKGRFYFYVKNKKGQWKKKFSCEAWMGKKGINKKREGDQKTPTGLYSFGQAFGILRNPGTKMPYIKVGNQHYWCGDSYSGTYNQLIRQDKTKHECTGEHLIEYQGVYDYAIFIGYNKKGKPEKGSAIFLHCSRNRATGGCIAIQKKYMKRLLKRLDPSSQPKILVY